MDDLCFHLVDLFPLLNMQNIEQGKSYEVIFYVRSTGSISIDVSLTSSDGEQVLATKNVM